MKIGEDPGMTAECEMKPIAFLKTNTIFRTPSFSKPT
jgi:hypothetical protein